MVSVQHAILFFALQVTFSTHCGTFVNYARNKILIHNR